MSSATLDALVAAAKAFKNDPAQLPALRDALAAHDAALAEEAATGEEATEGEESLVEAATDEEAA